MLGRSNSSLGTGVYGEAALFGILGVTETNYGVAVRGRHDGFIGSTHGGSFSSRSPDGIGALGEATSTSGTTTGLFGRVVSQLGRAVSGHATNRGSPGNLSYGGHFRSDGVSGVGVYGIANAFEGINYGVRGETRSPDGYAGYFEGGKSYFEGSVGIRHTSPTSRLQVNSLAGESALRVQVNGSTKLYVNSNGNVAIGGFFNPVFQLHVGGTGTAGKPGGGSWTNSSDRRLKKNIADLDSSLDRLLRLRGVTYEYKDPDAINELHGTRIGMIAQEVEEVFPDWVGTSGLGYKMLTFRGFEVLTVEALRELREEKDLQIADNGYEIEKLRSEKDAQIASLNKEVGSLRTQNESLEDRLAQLEALVAQLATSEGDEQ